MKLFLLLCLFCGPIYADIQKAEEITYDWLVKRGDETGTTDHISHFKKIFSRLKVRTCFEFGVDYSTKYFLDHCNKVISVEFVTLGYGPNWIKQFLNLYRNYSNWVPIVYFTGYPGDVTWAPYKYIGSESVYKAISYQGSTHRSYARIDNFYLKELDSFIGRLTQTNTIDLAFIGGGTYLRGDIVQLMFGRVPVIVGHGTSSRIAKGENDVYGYIRVTTPDDYEEIELLTGVGTTVWVKKTDELAPFIEALRLYAQAL